MDSGAVKSQASSMNDKLHFILNKSLDFITLINDDYRYEIVNDAYCWAMEMSREDIVGATVQEVWGKERFENFIKERLDRAFQGEESHFEERFTFGPFERNMRVSMYPYSSDGSETTHVAVFSYDVSRISEIESKLADYEYRDVVTGLFNRRSLDVILDMEIEKGGTSVEERRRALMFIKVQNLERAIQSYGHHVGDLLLENTGLRIKNAVPGSDHVFRFEGSNFVVLVDKIQDTREVGPLAQKIYNEIAVPYRYGNIDVILTSVTGITIFPDDGRTRDTLIQNAVSAQVEAENRGASFLLYNKQVQELAYTRMQLTTELHRALESESFAVHYHPIVDVDGRIMGAEALLRWTRPDGQTVPPAEFISLAEESGLISSIDKWVLYNVCKQVAGWGGERQPYVTVNMSAPSFLDPELASLVRRAMRNSNISDPGRIKIEITESQCMSDPDQAVKQMQRLRSIGIDVWIDDFGTGHSSLSYLRRLPATMMKLDKEFVQDLVDSPEDMVYLANIINSVRSQRKDVVIEGIESARQHELLSRLGASYMQGYLYTEPLSVERFSELLATGGRISYDESVPPST